MKFSNAFLISATFILVSCLYGIYKLHDARSEAAALMSAVQSFEVGSTKQAEATRQLERFDKLRKKAQDCFGGPCISGSIYRVHRSGFGPLWPEMELNIGLFFDNGVLVIKEAEFGHDGGAMIRTIEDAYPFPKRQWEHDLGTNVARRISGDTLILTLDRRASDESKVESFRFNLACFSAFRGCPDTEQLRLR